MAKLQKNKIKKSPLGFEDNNLHINLSIKEAWELVARLSKDGWFMQTGKKAPNFLDKTKIKIVNN
jgi:hypothetical protein